MSGAHGIIGNIIERLEKQDLDDWILRFMGRWEGS